MTIKNDNSYFKFSDSIKSSFHKILTLINWRIFQNLRSFTIYLAVILSILLGIGYGYIDGYNYLDTQKEYLNNIKIAQYGANSVNIYSQVIPIAFACPDPNSLIINSSIIGWM